MEQQRVRFKVAVLSYGPRPWIDKCLESLETQTYRAFDVCIIDDGPSSQETRDVISDYASRNGWATYYHDTKQGRLPNLIQALDSLECAEDDVAMYINGNDWLFSPSVFERLARIYEEEDVWLTYGQYIRYPPEQRGYTRAPSPKTFRRSRYRKTEWLYEQLLTFKSFLWNGIKDKDLRGPNGQYYGAAWNMAFTLPMLEMARQHIRHIAEVLYVCNDENPLPCSWFPFDEQWRNSLRIRASREYKAI